MDFEVTNNGSTWNIRAVSFAAKEFAEENFHIDGWQGSSDNFATDHRAGRALANQLISEGWRVE